MIGVYRARGFTLLELLVVIAILGVFMSMAVVRLDIGGIASNTERAQLLQFIRGHHLQSLQKGTAKRFTWEAGESSLTVRNHGTSEPLSEFLVENGEIMEPDKNREWILRPSGFDHPLRLRGQWDETEYQIESHPLKGAVIQP